jgi:hypothetical protein
MILAITGTHGAGKSTLLYEVARRWGCVPVYEAGYPQPVMMRKAPLAIIGSYQPGAFSGFDSGRFNGRMDDIFEWIHRSHEAGLHVLYEGMLVTGTSSRLMRLVECGCPVTVLWMNTPVDECCRSIALRKARRVTRHSSTPVNRGVVEAKARQAASMVARCRTLGVPAGEVSRATAIDVIWRLLGLTEPADAGFQLV